MEIRDFQNPLVEEKNYRILIDINDDLNAYEIAECFKSQYPKEKCVISFAKITKIEFGMVIVGLNLKGGLKLPNGRK